MYLLGIDFETTGLDPETDQIIEVGAVIWDATHNQPIEIFSKLVGIGSRVLPQKIAELTGITDEHLQLFGAQLGSVLDTINEMAKKCHFLVGHNAISFDRKILNQACKTSGKPRIEAKWIDTIIDVEYPVNIRTRKLSYLATEHKIIGYDSHRAVFDAIVMMQLLAKYNLQEITERAQSDLVTITAQVTYDSRSLAADAGFKWNPVDKTWSKTMREYDLKKLTFPFAVNVVKSKLMD